MDNFFNGQEWIWRRGNLVKYYSNRNWIEAAPFDILLNGQISSATANLFKRDKCLQKPKYVADF